MSASPKNLAASVKARLQKEAARRGDDFNLLLLRYGIERLLFRLSQSAYADRFLLKGAMLFVIWDEKTHRPTRDLDLLGFGPSEKEDLEKVFRATVALPVVDDGLVFDPTSVRAEEIREQHLEWTPSSGACFPTILKRPFCGAGPDRPAATHPEGKSEPETFTTACHAAS